jgi:hypothetical protein
MRMQQCGSSSAGVGLFDDMADFSFSKYFNTSEFSLSHELHEMEAFALLTEVEFRCCRNYTQKKSIRMFSGQIQRLSFALRANKAIHFTPLLCFMKPPLSKNFPAPGVS